MATALIQVTQKQIAKAFNEWDRRFRADPSAFFNEAARLLGRYPGDYGEACAAYLVALLAPE